MDGPQDAGTSQKFALGSFWIRPQHSPAEKSLLSSPEINGTDRETLTPSWNPFKRSGWRVALTPCTAIVAIVLIVNIALAIAAAAKSGHGMSGGIGTLYEGSCGLVNRWSIGLSLVINMLSSLVLAASNHSMQWLSSPTRGEIDRAHKNGQRLDVGIPSVRNVCGRISKKRTVTWLVLAISSLPVHLLYNSVVFTTDAANQYDVVIASRSFLDGGDFSNDYDAVHLRSNQQIDASKVHDLQQYFASDQVQEISTEECVSIFTQEYVRDHNAVLLLSSSNDHEWNNMSYMGAYTFGGLSNYTDTTTFEWLCGNWDYGCSAASDCSSSRARANASHLAIPGPVVVNPSGSFRCVTYNIDSCITGKVEGHCQLQYTLPLLGAVIVCNLLQLAAILWVTAGQRLKCLVTVGDAVASFLDEPDPYTSGQCLRGIKDMEEKPGQTTPLRGSHTLDGVRRWGSTVSGFRWAVTLILCLLGLVFVSILLGVSQDPPLTSSRQKASIFSGGLGNSNSDATALQATGSSGLLRIILLVNTPQLLCSCAYFLLNSLWTSMLLAAEWNGYYLTKKPLRTSFPRGEQRATYWLTLPLIYSVPLLAASTVLHWLISQSLFLVRIAEISVEGKPDSTSAQQVSSAQYSTLAIFISIIVGAVIVLVTVAFALLGRLKNPMPVAGSSSMAIAAACHRPADDLDAAMHEVSWGDVGDATASGGHCCFTTREVRALDPDWTYR